MATPEFATLTTDDLVTGEAVALDLPPASLGSRIASGLIDVARQLRPARRTRPRAGDRGLRTDKALVQVAMLASVILSLVVFPRPSRP